MRIDSTRTRTCRHALARIAGTIVFCALIALGAGSSAEEPMTTDEVVAELVAIAQEVTPFTVAYDKEQKWLIFREVLETSDTTAPVRIGELRARLDRMDPKRINYTPLEGGMFSIILKGKTVVGRVNFFCRDNQNCVARSLHGDKVTADFVDGEERTFGLDIFKDVTIGQIRRFADLIQHLMVVSAPK